MEKMGVPAPSKNKEITEGIAEYGESQLENQNQQERINDFYEGGAKKVFSEEVNKLTAEHGLVFSEQGKTSINGKKLSELIKQGILGEPQFYDEDPQSPMPRLSNEEIEMLGDIEIELFWEHGHFKLPIVPNEIREIDPGATKTNWTVKVNLSNIQKDDMWYKTRLHLGWTQEEVKKAREKGIHPYSPNISEMQE